MSDDKNQLKPHSDEEIHFGRKNRKALERLREQLGGKQGTDAGSGPGTTPDGTAGTGATPGENKADGRESKPGDGTTNDSNAGTSCCGGHHDTPAKRDDAQADAREALGIGTIAVVIAILVAGIIASYLLNR